MRFDNLSRWTGRTWSFFIVTASIAVVAAFLIWWPRDYTFDDGGIVLRYMDNFAAGAFYKYNLADPPVFGISGFIHGIVAGALAYSRAIAPDTSLLISNLIGVFLTSWSILLILRRFTSSAIVLVSCWFYVLLASYYFIITAIQYLETPLHLGIVLLLLWCLFADRRRTFWALCALSVISKLDAVPLVALLILLRGLSLRGRTEWAAEIRAALLFGAAPLGSWVVFTTWVFGSPMPQSAYAKLNYHDGGPSRLEFVTRWWIREPVRISIYWGLGLLAAIISMFMKRFRDARDVLALLGGCAGTLGLFMYFNPGERMPWYYAMPQVLLVLGGVVGFLLVIRILPRTVRIAACIAGVVTLTPATTGRLLHDARWFIDFVNVAEPDRIAMGKYVHSVADSDDRLLAGHGHIARYARIYVYDASGLNSPIVTDVFRRHGDPWTELDFDWITRDRFIPLDLQARVGMRLSKTFYRRSVRGNAAWRVWEKAPGPRVLTSAAAEIEGQSRLVELPDAVRPPLLHVETEGPTRFAFSGSTRPCGFIVGVQRQDIPLLARIVAGEIKEVRIPPVDPADIPFGYASEIEVSKLDPAGAVTLEIRDESGSPVAATLLEPVWLVAGIEVDDRMMSP